MHIDVTEACKLLSRGQPVGLPTETVYGLAAPLAHSEAIEKVFQIKGRPKNNPLIVHLSRFEQLSNYVEHISEDARILAKAFWPGPLTLILPVIPGKIPEAASSGLSTTAFRIPNHPLTLEVIARLGPLVMPSANISGKPSATQASHVENDFGIDFPVLEGGPCTKGLESTVLLQKDDQWIILRQGAIPAEAIAFVLGRTPYVDDGVDNEKPLCPGKLYRHYAPKTKLLLGGNISDAEAIVGFDDRKYPEGIKFISLGSSNKPQEAAAKLYTCLRELDELNIHTAWVDINFPRHNLWATIAERLQRAAQSQ